MWKKLIAAAVLSSIASFTLYGECIVKNGEKIAFLGDSITQQGNSHSGGYVNLVISGLKVNGIDAVKQPAGISGHKSDNMLARIDGVLDKKPQYMLLSCGVNDVGHGKRGVNLPDYKKNITAIIDKAQAAGVKVCIMTSTVHSENPKSPNNLKLVDYNAFLKEIANEKNCLLADVGGDMHAYIAALKAKYPNLKGNTVTYDGLHMNPVGNRIMAKGVLRALGLNDAEIAKAEASWTTGTSHVGGLNLTAPQTIALTEKAAAAGQSIQGYIMQLIDRETKK